MTIQLWSHFLEVLKEKACIDIALKSSESFFEAIVEYINFYNNQRPHSILMNQTPDGFETRYYRNHIKNNKNTTEQL